MMPEPLVCICINLDGTTERDRSHSATFWVRGEPGARRFYRRLGYVGAFDPQQKLSNGERVGWPVYGEITVDEFGGWQEPTPEQMAELMS